MSIAVDIEQHLGDREVDIFAEYELKPNSFMEEEIRKNGVVLYANKSDLTCINKIIKYCDMLTNFTDSKDSYEDISDWDRLALSKLFNTVRRDILYMFK